MNESEEKKLKDLVLIDRKEYRVRKREFWTKHGSTFTEISKISQENLLSWGKVIENHAKDYSENIAIKFEDKQITFKEQNELINQLIEN